MDEEVLSSNDNSNDAGTADDDPQPSAVPDAEHENPFTGQASEPPGADSTELEQAPAKSTRRRRSAGRPAGPPAVVDPFAVFLSPDEVQEPTPAQADVEPVPAEAELELEIDPADIKPTGPLFMAPEIDESDVEPLETPPKRKRKPKTAAVRDEEPRGRGSANKSNAKAAGDEAAGGDAEDEAAATADDSDETDGGDDSASSPSKRRRRRRRRAGGGEGDDGEAETAPRDEVTSVKGSTRLEAKRQRRKEGRDAGRRRSPIVSEAEFLARRESVDRVMVVRGLEDRTQIAVLEDSVLVEHYVTRQHNASMIGNVYLGKVQNVLPSMEAAFIDIDRGRNAVLYAGEVNWADAGLEGQPKRIELALQPGDSVLVQATKDPVGHKGARLTSQISLPGRYLVYVPNGRMTGISRKLPDRERTRLKKALRAALPENAGVIVRTAAEGASEEQLSSDVNRLSAQWEKIQEVAKTANAPALLYSEPDLAIRVVRDIFNEDFSKLLVSGDEAAQTIEDYLGWVAPELAARVQRWTGNDDIFAQHRIDEQITKALDRKVNLPSGGSLVIDRTEAMTVIDVNTGRFIGQGGNLEETVTRNNLEAAEEIVRQLRLRDIGGIIVVDFIDMVLESNRDLVVRRLVECLGRDRTKHQVAEITSLGLVQMTRKRLGQGLIETFSETCEHCNGRGVRVQADPVGTKRKRPPGPIPGAPINPPRSSDHDHSGGDSGEQTKTDDRSGVPVAAGVAAPE